MSMKITVRVGTQQNTFLLCGDDVCKTVSAVKQFCYCRFPHLENDKALRFYWTDLDDDEISVVTDGDYRSFLLATEKEKRRLFVEGKEAPQVDASVPRVQDAPPSATERVKVRAPVHSNVICDVCDKTIVGHRYRCLTCYDYDLCMSCESKYRHKDHVMLRIPRPPVGTRLQTHLVFGNMEHYARKLQLSAPDSSSSPVEDNKEGVGAGDGRQARKHTGDAGRHSESTKRRECPQQPCRRNGKRCPGLSVHSAMKRANAAAAAMADQQAHARFHHAISRFIDPANIRRPSETPATASSTSAAAASVAAATAAAAAAADVPIVSTTVPPTASNEELLTEAQRTFKIASDAAKVASAAAASSWNTFVGCANMFVPGVNSAASSGFPAGAAEGRSDAQNPCTPPTANGTRPNTASAVVGMMDEVLKHTPPEWKEFLPNEDEMNRLGEKISSLLGQFGLEMHAPSKAGEEPSSSSSSSSAPPTARGEPSSSSSSPPSPPPASAAGSVKDENEKREQADTVQPKHDEDKEREREQAADGGKPCCSLGLETDGVRGQSVENDECSANTSSASMLTDDDEDVLEADHVSEQSNNGQSLLPASSSRQEMPWTWVDLPQEEKEQEEMQLLTTTPTSGSEEKPTSASEPKQPETSRTDSEGPQGGRSSFEDLIVLLNQVNNERDPAVVDLLTLEIEKKSRKLVQEKEASKKESAQPVKEKNPANGDGSKRDPEEQQTGVDASSVVAPSTSASSPQTPASEANTASSRTYSRRPHVDHAIHTMMTMGFSNTDGHLTHLLESLDGDIPRALDLLMQKLS